MKINIPIWIPFCGVLVAFAYMFAYMNLTTQDKFVKAFSLMLLIIWCFFAGFVTYANLLTSS